MRSQLSRIEQEAVRRRERARAHLDRVQGRSGRRSPLRLQRPARLALFAGALAFGAGLLLGRPLLSVAAQWGADPEAQLDAIHVRGAVQLTPADVAAASGVARGAALAEVAPAQVEARLAEHPFVARVRALRMPAGTLVIGVEERVAVAVVRHADSTAYLDAEGVAFGEVAEAAAELPAVEPSAGFEIGRSDPRLAAAVELAYALPERGLALPEAVLLAADDDPEGVGLRLHGLPAQVVLGAEAPAEKLDALAELLASGLPGLATATRIDLRFAGQAVLRHDDRPGDGTEQAARTRGRATSSETGPTG